MRAACLLFIASALASAQTAQLPNWFSQQFFDNNGNPLNGGRVYSCTAGAACPGTPQTTYTDSSAFTANANPIILGTNGRPTAGGSVVGIWLTPSVAYKFVVQTSAGVTLYTVDNVTAGNGGGGSSTNYWTLSGSTISNNNAGGSGAVSTGGDLSVGSNLSVTQTIKMQTAGAQYAIIRAPNTMVSDVTWRWASADASGPLCSDGAGNLSFGTCGGGGGSGTPGGASTNVQYNNGGAFAGSANFYWNNGSQFVGINAIANQAGLAVANGFIQSAQGFLAVAGTATTFNAFQGTAGGAHLRSVTATAYVQAGHSTGAPSVTSGDAFAAGALYWDDGSMAMQVYNGAAWVSLGGGAGSPGGASTNVQFNSAGSFGGSSNFVWSNGLQVLTVTATAIGQPAIAAAVGYIHSDGGFNAPTSTGYNSFQAPNGGMTARSFTSTAYIQTGNGAATPSVTTSDTFVAGAMFYNTTSGCMQVYSGSSWSCLGTGGSGTPGGSDTYVQFNNAGAFGGSANMTWNNTTRLLNVSAIASTAGINVQNGYIQSAIGFVAVPGTATTFNALQATGGGVNSRSVTATVYTQIGRNSGTPSVTSGDAFVAGAMYWDTSAGSAKIYNGATWSNISTSGVSSVNSLTGALTVAGTTNQVNVSSGGTTITLSTPQSIATTSSPTFAGVTATGGFSSTASGASTAFQNNGATFLVNGNGIVNAITLQLTGGTGTGLNVTTNTDNNSIQTRGGVEACNAGTCSGGSALRINGSTVATSGGYWTGLLNMPLSGTNTIFVGTAGNFYIRYAAGLSTAVNCNPGPAVTDGWLALTGDFYLVACVGGVRYRSAFAAF